MDVIVRLGNRSDTRMDATTLSSGVYIRGQRVGHGGPTKNHEIGIFLILRILTPNLVSKVLHQSNDTQFLINKHTNRGRFLFISLPPLFHSPLVDFEAIIQDSRHVILSRRVLQCDHFPRSQRERDAPVRFLSPPPKMGSRLNLDERVRTTDAHRNACLAFVVNCLPSSVSKNGPPPEPATCSVHCVSM